MSARVFPAGIETSLSLLMDSLFQAAISSSVAAGAAELDAAILAAYASNISGVGGALGGITGFWIEPTGYWSVAFACAGSGGGLFFAILSVGRGMLGCCPVLVIVGTGGGGGIATGIMDATGGGCGFGTNAMDAAIAGVGLCKGFGAVALVMPCE